MTTKTMRSELIHKMRNSASALRMYGPTLSVYQNERHNILAAAHNLEQGANRIALDDHNEASRELMVFAYGLAATGGFALGIGVTLWFT